MPYGGGHRGARQGTRGQIIALFAAASGPLTAPRLIDRLGLSRTVAFYHLTRLEADGLIARLGDGERTLPTYWVWVGGGRGAIAA